jgi:hypothetical protein
LEDLSVCDGSLAGIRPVLVHCYGGIMSKKIGYSAGVVLVPVGEKDMGDGDVVVF